MFGYLSLLVERGIFKKIKVNFLLVGHSHDHIDKMFSRFSRKLARCDAFTLPTLERLITEAYTLKPDVQHLDKVYDFKRFWMVMGRRVDVLHCLIISVSTTSFS